MKTQTAILTLVALPLLATFAHGQNLFRTGRPDYARAPATYYERYANNNANWNVPSNSYRSNYASQNYESLERERLRSAWDNYRREANRYEARYGNATRNFAPQNDRRDTYRPSSFDRVAPAAYDSNLAPRRRCSSIPAYDDYERTRSRPAVSRPAVYDRYPDNYGSRNDFASRDFATNVNRTASRPFTSLLDSLFGTNR